MPGDDDADGNFVTNPVTFLDDQVSIISDDDLNGELIVVFVLC